MEAPWNDAEGWAQLTDADGKAYDPRPALRAVARGEGDAGYDELWERVHHQGDLGTAAYAVVPELVELMRAAPLPSWRAYALIATIEECRQVPGNPPIPAWIAEVYCAAMRQIVSPAAEHLRQAEADAEVRSLLAVLAHAKGQRTIAAIALWTEDERQEALGEL